MYNIDIGKYQFKRSGRDVMKKGNILIVDDDKDILNMIANIYEIAGFKEVYKATNGYDALEIVRRNIPNIVISDVMMPEMDGFELLQEIRAVSKVPVILLTAKNEAEDKFCGFELGADDYLAKPFLPKELLLRTEAVLNRTYKDDKRIVRTACACVDLDRAVVIRDGDEMALTAKEFVILEKLVENDGHIVSIGALCQCACGEIWQGYETSLMTHIRHLREKLENNPSEPVSLITVRGLGYKLILEKE